MMIAMCVIVIIRAIISSITSINNYSPGARANEEK
jgi:hypothetical protein